MEFFIEFLPLFMFLALAVALFSGYPVAFVLAGIGFLFWALAASMGLVSDKSFLLVISRVYGSVVDNLVLVAIPMFIFMGTMLEKSGVARDLLNALHLMMRRIPGGLALAVVLLGVIMAASTGIIGASVVMMTLLALPIMAEKKYDLAFSSGTIASAGTLGILIPPSIMLVVMGNLLSVSIGTLFFAALIPGLLLATLYVLYIIGFSALNPKKAPSVSAAEAALPLSEIWKMAVKTFVPPFALILLVLGSIFAGVATPTEASGIGAFGATVLAALKGKLNRETFWSVVKSTALIGAMLFGIFVGATSFSFVFALLGGHDLIVTIINTLSVGPWSVLLAIMLIVFLLGFFFDWIQIALIVMPVFAPIIALLNFGDHMPYEGLTVIWFAILMAVNLQTSFLTPPFGFALFYLKGSAPKEVKIQHIYKGVIPFVILQLIGLLIIVLWPEVALWLPHYFGL